MFCEKGGACNFIKKETLAQVFSCEFCEISKNTFFYRTPLAAASGCSSFLVFILLSPKVLFIDWKDNRNVKK